MKLWTTFCPQKISWEITAAKTRGKSSSSDWQKNIKIIDSSLQTLKEHGIDGIRLVIYPDELTEDGKTFSWKPIDKMLELCQENKILVDLCIGPFQYPNYPGVWLPKKLHQHITSSLDNSSELKTYGLNFINQQIGRYGNDKRIREFYLGNEWPDANRVQNNNFQQVSISKTFMTQCVEILKIKTKKTILFNTNIDPFFQNRIEDTYKDFFNILGNQMSLGFDIYPSQASWHKFIRLIEPYSKSVRKVTNNLDCEIFFAEIEAQPWGGGKSWYTYITSEQDPNKQILSYFPSSLKKTIDKYIAPCKPKEISLWGADFWLTAKEMGIIWPLKDLTTI